MKKLVFFITVIAFCISCQENQPSKHYFEQSPEIDIAKKAIDAYLKQDWEIFKSLYSDTARIWHNEYYAKNPGLSIDEVIESNKEPLASLVYYRFEGELWEMIVNNKGEKWVHFWGNWVAKLAEEGEDVEIPVHIAYGVVDNKIVYEAGFWDNFPLFLAQQAITNSAE